MKKIFLFVLLTSAGIFAQSSGQSGLSFLKIGFGARNIAMGDIGAVSAQDVTSIYYNPANISAFTSSEIIFAHNEWIQGIRSEMLGASIRLFGLPFGLGINTTTVSDIEVRNTPGLPVTKFNADYFALAFGTGFNLTDDFSIGVSAKYLYEGLLSDESTGIGFDAGISYKSPFEGLEFGASFRNLGKMNPLRNEETKLPSDFRIGSVYSMPLNGIKSELKAGLELQKYTAADDMHFNAGAEILYNNLLAIRAGYQTGYESKGISAGLGLRWGSLNFDYALTPFYLDLGTAHIVSIKFKF